MVDSRKMPLYHLDMLKQFSSKHLGFSIARIIPFEVFLASQAAQAFSYARPKIK